MIVLFIKLHFKTQNLYYNCSDLEEKYIYNLNTPDICMKKDYVYAYYVND